MKYPSRLLPLLILSLSFSGCASTPPLEKLSPEWRERNVSKFIRLLQRRDVENAARFSLIFDGSKSEDQALLAQLDLMLCRPQKAQQEIEKIPDVHQKEAFEAVLFGLVSGEPPAEEIAREKKVVEEEEIPAPPLNAKKTNEDLMASLDDAGSDNGPAPEAASTVATPPTTLETEVWQDEWGQIQWGASGCEMPKIRDSKIRMAAREKAKDLFEKLQLQDYYKDFNVVTLALDMNARIQWRNELLEHYHSQASDPYYQKLGEIKSEDLKPVDPGLKVLAQNHKSSEITLSELDLSVSVPTAHHHQIPILIGPAAGDEDSHL